jgi:hypothetical protein
MAGNAGFGVGADLSGRSGWAKQNKADCAKKEKNFHSHGLPPMSFKKTTITLPPWFLVVQRLYIYPFLPFSFLENSTRSFLIQNFARYAESGFGI